MKALPQLVYMASQLREGTPSLPVSLVRYLPQGELIQAAKSGVDGAALLIGVPKEQIENIIEVGRSRVDKATPEEFRLLAASLILENEEIQELPLDKRLKILGLLDKFLNQPSSEMIAHEEVDLAQIKRPPPMPTWNSGFDPIDIATGGLYQALLVLMGKPGTGKTSTMLSLAECIKRRYRDTRILFFEQEIPANLLLSRMGPIFDRGNPFTKEDKIICGNLSIDEITEKCLGNGKEQVVFLDSPDAMGGSAEPENRRFELEAIYRRLIPIKEASKLVVVASQPRRKDNVLSQASVAESWAKAWFADIIIGIMANGNNKMRMKTLKNRFGPPSNEVSYQYNLADLTFEGAAAEDDEW